MCEIYAHKIKKEKESSRTTNEWNVLSKTFDVVIVVLFGFHLMPAADIHKNANQNNKIGWFCYYYIKKSNMKETFFCS